MPIDRVQILAVVVSLMFLAAVLELVRRRRLVEEYAFLWVVVALLLLTVSIWRELLHEAARHLGVASPPNVLLVALTTAVLVALLSFSVILSRQRRQINRLLEDAAILSAEVREIRAAQQARPPERDGDAVHDSGPTRPAK
jgi:hypothetical protein